MGYYMYSFSSMFTKLSVGTGKKCMANVLHVLQFFIDISLSGKRIINLVECILIYRLCFYPLMTF